MIKAVLLDLDDTLIATGTAVFFATYLKALGEYASTLAPASTFIQQVITTYNQTVQTYDVTDRLYPRFVRSLKANFGHSNNGYEMEHLFSEFYSGRYADLRPLVRPRPETPGFLQRLAQQGYRIAIATNPAIPESATLQRMAWGGIPAQDYSFAAITTLENMHFGKPQTEYFEEILLRLDVTASEAIMIGDDWENDIVGAAACGMNTFWITEQGALPPDDIPISGYGSYRHLIALVEAGWLDILSPPPSQYAALIHRLRAFPAELDTLRKTYDSSILEHCPAEKEWSARDIICHLCDHEATEDRVRLRRIVEENNPFLSANYDPWSKAHDYHHVSIDRAFLEFVQHRTQTVEWLLGLPEETWSRPARYAIFGPTYFEEMVRFTTEHDRTHLLQIRDAIAHALKPGGSSSGVAP
jgi:HAD superfamily hydrolase (TIGR01662 family)